MVYFLIVNYNSKDLIHRLIVSLDAYSPEDYQIIIINNSLQDQEISQLRTEKIKIIDSEENLGFGKACNLGLTWIYAQNSRAIVWLINPDTYFDSTFLNPPDLIPQSPISRAIAFFQQYPQISILGTIVYNSSGEITSAGGTFTSGTAALAILDALPRSSESEADYFKTDWVSGCSLLLNLANFAQCPNFDPRYFLYYEDLDFCLRYGQQGHKIAVTPWLKVFHDTSSISDRNLFSKYQHITKSYLIHIEKHGSFVTFILTNLRMCLNTFRLLILKPQQGLGKLIGICNYWQTRLLRQGNREIGK